MKMQLRHCVILILMNVCISSVIAAEADINVNQHKDLITAEKQEISPLAHVFDAPQVSPELNSFVDDQRNQAAIGEDLIQTRSVLSHNIYENDRFRIYNNTEYSLDDVKHKYQERHLQQLSFSDFSLSLGYGMEYQLKKNQWIGYEYLSTFPQDYGQAIRMFWKKRF